MKKTVLLLSLVLFSVIALTACGKKEEEQTENVQPTEIVDNSNCEATVQKYLD
jgi:predicted small lipoprotein YifL